MIYILIFVIAMLFSAFFSSSEIAYTSLNVIRLEKLVEEGNKRAKLALKIRNSYDFTLSSLLIGNDLVNIAMSSCATVLAIRYAIEHQVNEGTANTIGTILVTIAVLIFGEITPKIIAKQYALEYALAVAYPLRAITLLFWFISKPVSTLMEKLRKKLDNDDVPTVTEDELSTLIETAEEEGAVDEDQADLLQSALDYQETTVEDILVPRIKIEGIEISSTKEEVLQTCLNTRYSRLAVYEESLDHILGFLSVNHYLQDEANGESSSNILAYVTEPYVVYPTSKLPQVLKHMRDTQVHIALVMDEYGGTMGIVTMEDILEEIVGEIWDEQDQIEKDSIVEIKNNSYEVDGLTPITEVFETIGLDDKDFESEYTTMGGWAVEMLEENPHVGDSFEYENITIKVLEMEDNLVKKLQIDVKEKEKVEE